MCVGRASMVGSDGVQIDTYLDRGDIELWDTRAAP
jgi:hypothetical protein